MILITTEKKDEPIASICEDIWDLPTQVDELKSWLRLNIEKLNEDNYIADIGFGIRKDACGGGAVIDSELIELLSWVGMEIYFSEYNFVDIEENEN